MASIVKIEIENTTTTVRGHARIMRYANRKAMTNHRDKRLGKHYQNIPETRPGGAYGYAKRSEKYTERKRRKKGHTRPLTYSGYMARFVRNNSRITATQKRARFKAKNYFPMTQQRRDELEVISEAERKEISQEIQQIYVAESNKPKNKRKRRKKIQ